MQPITAYPKDLAPLPTSLDDERRQATEISACREGTRRVIWLFDAPDVTTRRSLAFDASTGKLLRVDVGFAPDVPTCACCAGPFSSKPSYGELTCEPATIWVPLDAVTIRQHMRCHSDSDCGGDQICATESTLVKGAESRCEIPCQPASDTTRDTCPSPMECRLIDGPGSVCRELGGN
ncbi:MAG: hypothetical protein JST54_28500 [Deltaproteobacteria bacterium]|nr:hypothetical protein [Deltaproteobacteria bacterium]